MRSVSLLAGPQEARRVMYTEPPREGERKLRHSDMDAVVDIRFECGPNGSLRRTEPLIPQQLRVETIFGQVSRPVAGFVVVPEGTHCLCFNNEGTLLARSSPHSRLVIIPPRSATFLRSGARLIVQAARGPHEVHILSWRQSMTPLLDNWAAGRATKAQASPGRLIACRPIDPHLQDAYKRFEEARSGNTETAEPMMLSAAYEIIAKLMTSSDEVQLAAIPSSLPETIRELTVTVRDAPAHPWPLRDAANAAGYSPFHFSRVFKQMVGYGFHEYVDRCRTEASVEMLVNTDTAVDLVASACGFGTTQGLRESIKEYLGLVPSELRAVPEIGAFVSE